MNGFLAILIILILAGYGFLSLVHQLVALSIVILIVVVVLATGIFTLSPNKAVAIMFFGTYIGTVRKSGLWWSVPLSTRRTISLRVRNFNSDILKVNDVNGNPIEIAAVVVYRVIDSAKALFDVENYERFVQIQSETALRHVVSRYPYDNYEHDQLSLRGNSSEVRFTHLAYATEIAGAMLQRQQAAAVVAARSLIVEGAVGMVKLAIQSLEDDHIIELDEERKANMINNLMVAITSERSAQPIINTGTLY